jgi:hypothetical protein
MSLFTSEEILILPKINFVSSIKLKNMFFAKDTGIIIPPETVISTRGASKLFVKETGTVSSPSTSTSTKGGNGNVKK